MKKYLILFLFSAIAGSDQFELVHRKLAKSLALCQRLSQQNIIPEDKIDHCIAALASKKINAVIRYDEKTGYYEYNDGSGFKPTFSRGSLYKKYNEIAWPVC